MNNVGFKDSGVQWLGEIPQHWEVVKGKRLHKCPKILNVDNACKEVLSLTLRGVVDNDIDNPEGLIPKDYATYQIFEKDDLVFKLIDLENVSTSRVGLVHKRGIMSPAYIRLQISEKCNSKFIYYFYYSLYLTKVFNHIGSGVRQTLNANDLLELAFPLPPLDEQRRIAEFLDKKCEKIAEFIDKKQQIISLLKEQKLALINESTCGRIHTHNDNQTHLKFKHSGIEWLGEIPQHWEVRKLKFVVTQRNDKAGENDFKIGLENIESQTGKFIQTDENPFDDCGIEFKAGDILFGKLRPYLAKVYLTEQSGSCVSEFLVLNAIDIDCFFLKFLMLSHKFIQIVNSATYGTKMPRASWEFIGNLKIPLPPLNEQRRIAEFLDKKCEKIDKAIALIEQEIQAIKEYKTSLIDKAVRGQI